TLGQHDYLAELASGGEVVGAEGAVAVAGDGPVAIEVANGFVEVVGGLHVGETHRAWSGRRRGREAWAAVALHQGLIWDIAVVIVTYGPDIAGRYGCYPIEMVVQGANIGAGHDAPIAPVPVLYQRLISHAANVVIIAHSPDIVGRYGCYCLEVPVDAG